MEISKEIMKNIEGRLRRPVHIDYITNYIVKLPIEKTRELLNQLVSVGIIEESGYAKDYYVLKNQNQN